MIYITISRASGFIFILQSCYLISGIERSIVSEKREARCVPRMNKNHGRSEPRPLGEPVISTACSRLLEGEIQYSRWKTIVRRQQMASTWLSLCLGVAKESILPPLWRPHDISFPKGMGKMGRKRLSSLAATHYH